LCLGALHMWFHFILRDEIGVLLFPSSRWWNWEPEMSSMQLKLMQLISDGIKESVQPSWFMDPCCFHSIQKSP
jgi:hypothetical protein